ncbi:MAG: fumarylacetoacetate hydrolase family protein [Halopseudomonas sp.]
MKLCRFHLVGKDPQQVECGVADIEQQAISTDSRSYRFDEVQLLAPAQPGKIICVGLNYRGHQNDGHTLPQQPLIFLKPASAATGPEALIPFPTQSQQIDFEGELGLVISRETYQIEADQAANHILGYCCANDVTARDIQQAEGEHTRAKGFNGFAPFGPWLETDFDPYNFNLNSYLNGELKQSTHSRELLFSIPELVSFISQVMPLDAGDLILTGTPQGMGPMQPGDEVRVEISGIGTLRNTLGQPHQQQSDQELRYG